MIKAIYRLTNRINGKMYIGQSVRPQKRLWEHQNHARIKDDNYPIHLAIAKYGINNFDFEIIGWTEDYDNRESYYIQKYNTLCPNGYNVLEGGHSPIMIGDKNPRNTITDEQLKQIIKDLKSNKYSDRELAKKYKTTDKIIADINHGHSHHMDNEEYPLRIKKGLQKLTLEQVENIKNLLRTTDETYQSIANKYNVSKGVIYHINKGLTFFDINEIYPIRAHEV